MIVMLIPLFLIITLKTSRCSLIIDGTSQKGLHLSDYCPSTKYCREGSHVMCAYYDPQHVYGPRCGKTANITVTAELANQLLEIMNSIRSKVAFGIEVGKDKEPLPRAYGMMRLKWDNELATFAQVLSNQCILRHDMCRASKKFPSPTQGAGLVRFSYPDWMPAYNPKKINYERGVVNLPKLMYAINQCTGSWYEQKKVITEAQVKVYPDWIATPQDTYGKIFLEIVHGPATHMGCGITGYTEYVYFETVGQGIHNSIQLVCNFSAGPRKGDQTYEVVPPIPGQGYSPKCGCPPGTQEDADCLCNEVDTERTCSYGQTGNCDPTLVLLPIFTVEDAPPEKLYQMAEDIADPLKNFVLQRLDNSSENNVINKLNGQKSEETFGFNHKKEEEVNIWHSSHKPIVDETRSSHKKSSAHVGRNSRPPPPPPRRPLSSRTPLLHSRASISRTRHPPPPVPPRIPPPLPSPPPPPPPPKEEYTTALQTHEDPILASCDDRRSRPLPRLPLRHRPVTKKSSIFTKIPQFQLPKRKRMSSPLEIVTSKSVQRRRNSNLNKVVNDYVKHDTDHETIDNNHEQNTPKEKSISTTVDSSETDVVVTETGLNKAEEVVINFNQYIKHKNDTNYNDKDVDIKDDNDNKLLSLLDNLEREVKHVALDGNERELFDVKLRKIYGTVIGKTASLKFPQPILLSTAGVEDTEIDFGETKNVDKLDHREDKVVEEPIKRTKHHQIAKKVERIKSYDYPAHKRKIKISDSYLDIRPSEVYDHIYNDNFDNSYGDMDHKYMNDLDHKYNENLNKKKIDNNLDREHNDGQHKFNDNYNHQRHLIKKHDNDIPASRIKKYEVTKAVFREFGNSHEASSKIAGYHKDLLANDDIPDRKGLIAKDIDKIKRKERIHRNKVKSLSTHNNFDDPLDLERRKYYQDKLYNIKKKLRSRKTRRDSSNDRSRRTHSKNRETSRTKSKSDDFYMPDRPGFLHGF